VTRYEADDSPSGTDAGGEAAVRGDVLSSSTRGRTSRRWPAPLWSVPARQLRRPLRRLLALYRRSIQLRVVAATLLLSVVVVLVLGVVVVAQVRTGLLDTKKHAAQGQALGGFQIEQD
jgi:two-component system sensor histidine kinase MtrB